MPHKTIEARREYARKWAMAHPGYGAAKSRKRRLLHPDSGRQDYLKHKAGYVARAKAWQERNPEKAKASKRKALLKVRTERPEYCRELCRAWQRKNHDKIISRARAKYAANRDEIVRKKALWREANRDKISAQIKRRTLSGKTAEQDHRRRAKLKDNGWENCSGIVKELRKKTNCHWCDKDIPTGKVTIDHVIPISRGGTHTKSNLVAACYKCNLSKGSKLLHEWKPNEYKEAA